MEIPPKRRRRGWSLAAPPLPSPPTPTVANHQEFTSMTSAWNDFNDAKSVSNLIPKGTLAKVRLTIRRGTYNDPSQGWDGGYATRGTSDAVYLDGEFTVLDGPFARRKVFALIGLYSPKGPDWGNSGRAF